ncbi:hypothetical protein TWF730_003778 [Orbilia blumenaviensis]|uniref:Uncharacterized protein n=1 Tax=Orbilia blumenaviensis TaxID=1796055 RepID=A0AAV9U392_9PEZI
MPQEIVPPSSPPEPTTQEEIKDASDSDIALYIHSQVKHYLSTNDRGREMSQEIVESGEFSSTPRTEAFAKDKSEFRTQLLMKRIAVNAVEAAEPPVSDQIRSIYINESTFLFPTPTVADRVELWLFDHSKDCSACWATSIDSFFKNNIARPGIGIAERTKKSLFCIDHQPLWLYFKHWRLYHEIAGPKCFHCDEFTDAATMHSCQHRDSSCTLLWCLANYSDMMQMFNHHRGLPNQAAPPTTTMDFAAGKTRGHSNGWLLLCEFVRLNLLC